MAGKLAPSIISAAPATRGMSGTSTSPPGMTCSAAAQHEMGLACAPKTLPAAAGNAMFRSLIKPNLLSEINAPRDHVGLSWRQVEAGRSIVARITDEGLRAIVHPPPLGSELHHHTPGPKT